MTTADFIGRVVRGDITKPRTCSSVYFDGTHIYSYGSHYPLLVNVLGAWILNDAGYSNSTAKHINWAGQHADYRMAMDGPEVSANFYAEDATIKELAKQVTAEFDSVQSDLAKLRKGAFRKQEYLENRRTELTKTMGFLDGALTRVTN